MTAIRPIHRNEAEPFLELLCTVFGLDYNRAYSIFFDEPYFDLARKWAVFQGAEIVSILTVTPLEFGWGKAIGIAGVATKEKYRREGYASRLIQKVLNTADHAGEGSVLLFAQRPDLYAPLGFEMIDRVVRAPLPPSMLSQPTPLEESRILDVQEVREVYDRWAAANPDRLVRDDRRWQYFLWNYRVAEPVGGGYAVVEPNLMREALYHRSTETLPFPPGSEWLGTTFMADQLGLVFTSAVVELFLMGRNFPRIPQFFMTDQF